MPCLGSSQQPASGASKAAGGGKLVAHSLSMENEFEVTASFDALKAQVSSACCSILSPIGMRCLLDHGGEVVVLSSFTACLQSTSQVGASPHASSFRVALKHLLDISSAPPGTYSSQPRLRQSSVPCAPVSLQVALTLP
jgi:hypothetical protein